MNKVDENKLLALIAQWEAAATPGEVEIVKESMLEVFDKQHIYPEMD
jgi:hypothetical protein